MISMSSFNTWSLGMMSGLNVLCLRVLNWILGKLDGTSIVAEEWYFLRVDAIVHESLLHP